jgi:hypothetical protein
MDPYSEDEFEEDGGRDMPSILKSIFHLFKHAEHVPSTSM